MASFTTCDSCLVEVPSSNYSVEGYRIEFSRTRMRFSGDMPLRSIRLDLCQGCQEKLTGMIDEMFVEIRKQGT